MQFLADNGKHHLQVRTRLQVYKSDSILSCMSEWMSGVQESSGEQKNKPQASKERENKQFMTIKSLAL